MFGQLKKLINMNILSTIKDYFIKDLIPIISIKILKKSKKD